MNDSVEEKRAQLYAAGERIKRKLIGIDYIIDDVIKKIEIWWCYPEFLTRPLVICLWGMTGCGKTDFVKTLVAELGLGDKFADIEIGNSKIDPYVNMMTMGPAHSVLSRLIQAEIKSHDQSILLIDEIQKARSINSKNEEVNISQYDDMWKLLSDGRLGDDQFKIHYLKKQISSIQEQIMTPPKAPDASMFPLGTPPEMIARIMARQADIPQYIDMMFCRLFGISPDDINNILMGKMMFGEQDAVNKHMNVAFMNGPVESYLRDIPLEYQLMFFQNKLAEYTETLRSTSSSLVYSKMLIFICGNLDNVYKQAKNFNDMTDDEIRKETEAITLTHIKQGLAQLFRPEQISRFGNIHEIYRSLRHSDFRQLVIRETMAFINSVKENHGILIITDDSDIEEIWKRVQNVGIFAAQGVRPILASISSVLGDIVPPLLVEAKKEGKKDIYLDLKKRK